jgi:hypothetical protein
MGKDISIPPILFLVFNREALTKKVFDVIRKSEPSQLFIAADGPRKGNKYDTLACQKTRGIVSHIDWKCEVHTLFRDDNLGCKVAITSAIDWFFENVEQGIILEDDCLPSESFFWFCDEILEKYRLNDNIMQINGNFHLHNAKDFSNSYYFSKLNACWGWATWKRAWKNFDTNMSGYIDFKKSKGIEGYYEDKEVASWMKGYLDDASLPTCGIWSTQWAYAIMKNDGLCINPTVNLVNNIGFFDSPTSGVHESFSGYSKYLLEEIDEIVHPKNISYNCQNDKLEFTEVIKNTDPRLLVKKNIRYYLTRVKSKLLSLFQIN